MSWFRTKIRATAWLALFALAVQFTLAFGHHHHEDDIHIVAGLQGAEVHSSVPAQGMADDDETLCTICASIALAGTLVLPPAPTIEQPQPRSRALPMRVLAAIVIGEPQRPFQARAPPA